MEDQIMKGKRKYETPKVEVLEVRLSERIAADTCQSSATLQINMNNARKDPVTYKYLGDDNGGVSSWDDSF